MIRMPAWKYVHHRHFRPQLFDLTNGPQEFADLGDDDGYRSALAGLRGRLLDRLERRKRRGTGSDPVVEARTGSISATGTCLGGW